MDGRARRIHFPVSLLEGCFADAMTSFLAGPNRKEAKERKNSIPDTSRLNSYLLDSFIRFAGIPPMNYSIEPDDGWMRFDLRRGGEGI